MGDAITAIYQKKVVEHSKNPRNRRIIEGATHRAKGANALCGDEIEVMLVIENNTIKDIAYQVNGCALLKASASIMTELVSGNNIDETIKKERMFSEMLVHEVSTAVVEALGDASVFRIMKQYPGRNKCVTLPWRALIAALNNEQELVTTEKGST